MGWLADRWSRIAVSTAIVAVGVAAPALAAALPRNSVGPQQIEPRAVRSAELAHAAVRRVHIDANAVDGTNVLDGALSGFDIADNSLTGADVDEASLDLAVLQARLGGCEAGKAIRSVSAKGRPTCVAVSAGGEVGPLGGDLTGTLPNPSIAGNAVTSAKVLNDTLTGSDIDESTLAGVPSALDADELDGLDSTDFLGAADTAGGDLGGTFSSLDLVANAVDAAELGSSGSVDADRAVTTNAIKNDAITSAKVPLNELTGSDVLESSLGTVPSATAADTATSATTATTATSAASATTAATADDADLLDGVDYSAIDSRLDALCAEADTINQEVRDLRTALDIPTLTGLGVGLDLSAVNLPDFDPAPCQA